MSSALSGLRAGEIAGGHSLLVLAAALFATASFLACSSEPDQSIGLVDEASELVDRGLEQEQESYISAYQLYRAALKNLKTVAELYPSSPAAKSFVSDEFRVGPFGLEQLYTHARQTGLRAEAEASPLACTRYVIDSISEPANRAKLLGDLAVARFRNGAAVEARELLERASEAVARIEDDYDRAMAKAALVEDNARIGKLEEALTLLEQVGPDGSLPGISALVSLALAYRSHGDNGSFTRYRDRARRALSRMGKAAAHRDGAVVAVSRLYSDKAEDAEVREMAGEMKDPSARVRVYAQMASRRLREGDKDSAAAWIEDGLRLATAIEEPYALSTALGEIAAAYDEAGDLERAEELLGQSLSVAMGIKEFSSVKAGALAKVARKYARAGQYDMAFVIAEAMIGSRRADNSWAKAGIAHYFSERGEFERALPVVFSIRENQVKLMTLGQLLIEYSEFVRNEDDVNRTLLHYIVRELG